MLSKLFGRPAGGHPGTIGFEELKAELESGACKLVDVREPHEFAAGHAKGAVNMPLSHFHAGELPKGRVVLICQAGARSARALALAHGAGRMDVVHFAPGTGGWRSMGGPISH